MSEKKAYELTEKEIDFSRWFDELLFKAEILDDRYPVKGMYVWLPYGYSIMENIMNIMERLMRETGHKRVYFPSIVPESVLSREFNFIKGFQNTIYWITRVGLTDLNERLALRPTSEAIMYEILSRWIKSYADLPLRIYQVVPVYRYETKATRPMLRVREIAFFKEGHTFHATFEEAEEQIKLGVEIYKRFYDELLIPYIVVKTPPWDTFPGAHYNYDLITVMPDGKALELGSVINFGDLFAKTYNLQYVDRDGSKKYVNTTSFGISERSFAAVIGILGDNKGLRLPPKISPIKVVIVPIPAKEHEREIEEYAREVYRVVSSSFSSVLDDREDEKPGYKFYKWEIKGIPVRVEVGEKELKDRTVTLFRRDTGDRVMVRFEEVNARIEELLRDIEENLRREALEYFRSKIAYTEDKKAIKELLEKKIVSFPWCGKKECALDVEEAAGYSLLGYEENKLEGENKKCISCGEKAVHLAWVGRSY